MADPFPPDYDRATGVAWMTEQVGGPPDDPFGVDVAAIQAGARLDQYAGPHYVASARFSVHVESDILRDGYAELHEWAELAEALELARARATRVIVRLADGREYSAGEEEFDTQDGDLDEEDDQLLPWPAEGLTLQPRRLAGWEFLDRTEDDDPISWDVLASGDVVAQPPGFEPAFLRALNAADDIVVGRVRVLPFDEPEPALGSDGKLRVVFSVSGDSLQVELTTTCVDRLKAVEVAVNACAAASKAALAELGVALETTVIDWNAAAFPTGSAVAAQHGRINVSGED